MKHGQTAIFGALLRLVVGGLRRHHSGLVLTLTVMLASLSAKTTLAKPPAPDAEAEYSLFCRLRNPQLVLTEQATVHDLTLPLPDIALRFERGTIFRVAPIDGRITGFYFVGKGSAEFTPSDSLEAQCLDRYTLNNAGRERYLFERLYCRFPDWDQLTFSRTPAFVPTLGLQRRNPAVEEPDHWLLQRLAQCQDGARLPLGHPDVELLEEIRDGGHPKSFYAVYGKNGSRGDSERWYCFQPRDVEPIAYTGWIRYRPAAGVVELPPPHDSPVEPLWFDIEAEIDSLGHIDFRVEGRYLVTTSVLTRVFLNFAPVFKIHEVTDEHKQPLNFWVEPAPSGPQGMLVFLPLQRVLGDTVILRFSYEGAPAVATEAGTFHLPRGLNWVPISSFSANAVFDARFTYPPTMSLIASGRKIRELETAQHRRSFWVSNGGVPDFTFAFGNYGVKDYFYEGMPTVTLFTPRLRHGPSAADSIRDVVGDVLNGLSYFQKVFGACPFQSLAVGEAPGIQHGEFAGLIHLPDRAFEPAEGRILPTDCEHGVAGQWWGYVLRPNSYRDQWLIEGLAEYSAVLYFEKSRKRRDLASAAVRSWKDEVNAGSDVPAAGPLSLGARLPERFLVAKGATVMHMLRMMMADLDIGSDRRFQAMLRDFLEYYRGRAVTTQDFQHQAELYCGESLDWFFQQWVYGTDLPFYAVRHEVEHHADGKYWVQLEVKQSGVDAQFKMPVPVIVTFGHGRPYRGRVWVSGATTTARLGPFDDRPIGLVFNDFDAVLTCGNETVERIAETGSPR